MLILHLCIISSRRAFCIAQCGKKHRLLLSCSGSFWVSPYPGLLPLSCDVSLTTCPCAPHRGFAEVIMYLSTGKDELRDYFMHPRGPWFEAKENKLILVQGLTWTFGKTWPLERKVCALICNFNVLELMSYFNSPWYTRHLYLIWKSVFPKAERMRPLFCWKLCGRGSSFPTQPALVISSNHAATTTEVFAQWLKLQHGINILPHGKSCLQPVPVQNRECSLLCAIMQTMLEHCLWDQQ